MKKKVASKKPTGAGVKSKANANKVVKKTGAKTGAKAARGAAAKTSKQTSRPKAGTPSVNSLADDLAALRRRRFSA